jgi:aspartokinase/homoserine dehydrogenase 1
MTQYKKIRKIMTAKNKKFLYTTNVGSGLPVIPTLRQFVTSGDEITKIEMIASGSLSYLFNNLNEKNSFSSIIKKAVKSGYMEPDPREDLNGNDVARKLLILARELGYNKEIKDIKYQNLVPPPLRKLKTTKDFMQKLPIYDNHFLKMVQKAKLQNRKLCYLAELEKGKAKASLQALPKTNPISQITDMDNIFVFHTKRYLKRPFIIWGAGAGGDVTAAGVLRDIISI